MAKYSIVDIETTGTSARDGRIIEIAIFNYEDGQITDEFSTLVNPEQRIPWRITQMTGISDAMVTDAPRFYEIARRVVEMTEGRVFVAHNVGFDYSFIREEFKNLGYRFEREKLCTVKLSRRLMPGHRSYSLGNLCADLGIEINGRHRAAGDALATVRLFEQLLAIDPDLLKLRLKGPLAALPEEVLRGLPEEPGVYYFYNQQGDIIYIGKSRNIKERVLQHLHNETTRKALEMRAAIADVSYELTGNDLVAQLLESEEIKRHTPLYNRQQRRIGFNIGLFARVDEKGYLCLRAEKLNGEDKIPITTFNSMEAARRALFALTEEHRLCQKLNGLYRTKGACFHHSIGQCDGACIGEESPESYNQRVEAAIAPVRFEHDNFFLIHRGRSAEEKSVVAVLNGSYRGFGYFHAADFDGTTDFLQSCVQRCNDTRDARNIIRSALRSRDYEKWLIITENKLVAV